MSHFSGFPKDCLKFLKELAENNNREWFTQNRELYDTQVRLPAKQLIAVMADRFEDLGIPYRADDKTSMFRINRDTRFSKDKTPYKTNVGLFFPYVQSGSTGKPVENPGLYLHIESGQCFIGGGIYMPTPEQLKIIRTRLSERFDTWKNIISDKNFQSVFPSGIRGESLKTMPRGFESDDKAAEYIKQKQWYMWEPVPESALITEEIIDVLEEKAIHSEKFHEFLSK